MTGAIRAGQVLDLTLALPGAGLPPARTHPRAAWIRGRHDAWFGPRLDLLPRPVAARLRAECEGVGLMCAALPDADAERLVGISLAASVLLLLDDLTDADPGERARADDYLALLDGHRPDGASPALALLADTLDRVRQGVEPRLWQRFTAGMRRTVAAGAAKHAAQPRDLAGYLAVRRADAAFDLVGVAIEHGYGLDLEQRQRELAAFHEVCCRHAVLVNDLLSLRKEYVADEPMNAVQVLRRAQGLTMQQAVDGVCAALADAQFGFLALAPDVPRAYAAAWAQVLSGNLHWSLRCPRYVGRGPGWSGPGLPRRMELHPDRTVYR